MNDARQDVLVYRPFPQLHWRKIWSANWLGQIHGGRKHRTRVVGIFPNDAVITQGCLKVNLRPRKWG